MNTVHLYSCGVYFSVVDLKLCESEPDPTFHIDSDLDPKRYRIKSLIFIILIENLVPSLAESLRFYSVPASGKQLIGSEKNRTRLQLKK